MQDVVTGKELSAFSGHVGDVKSVAFSPDGRKLASGSLHSTGGDIKIWEIATKQEIVTLNGNGHVAFSPDGRKLATLGEGSVSPTEGWNTAKLWDADTGKELATLKGHENDISSIAFSPDGRMLATGAWDETVRLWDSATGKELMVLKGGIGNILS